MTEMMRQEPIEVSEITEDRTPGGFIRHRCFCRYRTVLGAHGFDEKNRYCYKIVIKDRAVIIYFGAFILVCKDCSRWHRVRLLPKEKRLDTSVMTDRPKEDDIADKKERIQ